MSTSSALFRIVGFSDLYVDACVRDEAGQVLLLSIFGRDTALHQLTAAFHLPASGGGIASLELADADLDPADSKNRRHVIGIGDAKRLEKFVAKLPKGGLFGNLTHMWIYDPAITRTDRATGNAWLLYPPGTDNQEIEVRLWTALNTLSSVPLMPGWRSVILHELRATGHIRFAFDHAPLGALACCRLRLPEDFNERVSALIKARRVKVDDLPQDVLVEAA